jgi:hypothetical protein
VSKAIIEHYSASGRSIVTQARLIENIANSFQNPNSLALKLDGVNKIQFLEGLGRANSLGKFKKY